MEEAECMRLNDLRQVHQPAQLLRRRGNADGDNLVPGSCRSDQVADRADTANAGSQPGHFPEGPPDAKALEPAEFADVKACVLYLSGIIQEDRYLGVPFDPRHGIDDDALGHESCPPCLSEPALAHIEC